MFKMFYIYILSCHMCTVLSITIFIVISSWRQFTPGTWRYSRHRSSWVYKGRYSSSSKETLSTSAAAERL